MSLIFVHFMILLFVFLFSILYSLFALLNFICDQAYNIHVKL